MWCLFYQHLAAVLLRKRTKCRCYKVNIVTGRRVTKVHRAAARRNHFLIGFIQLSWSLYYFPELLLQMWTMWKIKIIDPTPSFPLMRLTWLFFVAAFFFLFKSYPEEGFLDWFVFKQPKSLPRSPAPRQAPSCSLPPFPFVPTPWNHPWSWNPSPLSLPRGELKRKGHKSRWHLLGWLGTK